MPYNFHQYPVDIRFAATYLGFCAKRFTGGIADQFVPKHSQILLIRNFWDLSGRLTVENTRSSPMKTTIPRSFYEQQNQDGACLSSDEKLLCAFFSQKHHLIGRETPPTSRDNYTGGTTPIILESDYYILISIVSAVICCVFYKRRCMGVFFFLKKQKTTSIHVSGDQENNAMDLNSVWNC